VASSLSEYYLLQVSSRIVIDIPIILMQFVDCTIGDEKI